MSASAISPHNLLQYQKRRQCGFLAENHVFEKVQTFLTLDCGLNLLYCLCSQPLLLIHFLSFLLLICKDFALLYPFTYTPYAFGCKQPGFHLLFHNFISYPYYKVQSCHVYLLLPPSLYFPLLTVLLQYS